MKGNVESLAELAYTHKHEYNDQNVVTLNVLRLTHIHPTF